MSVVRAGIQYFLLLLVAAVMLIPLIWLIAGAFKYGDDFYRYDFFPPLDRLSLGNYRSLFDQLPFARFLVNSFFITGATVLIQLLLSSLGGFALAKYEFRGKRLIMLIMLSTMIIPGEVLLAPLYELIYRLGMMDSYPGVIVPHAVSVLGIFLFAQSMRQIPDDLLMAGRIDGCSEWKMYWLIALPVSRPMIGAFCLIAFMGTWNSFIWPLVILHSEDRFTLPLGLNHMVGVYKEDYGALMAGTLLSVLPVGVLFFALQRDFIAGLTSGAVKG